MLPRSTTKRILITCPECKGRCEIQAPIVYNTSSHYIMDFTISNQIYQKQTIKCNMCNGVGQIVEIITKSYSLNLEE